VTGGPNISTWRGLAVLVAIAVGASALVGFVLAVVVSLTTHATLSERTP